MVWVYPEAPELEEDSNPFRTLKLKQDAGGPNLRQLRLSEGRFRDK
jgi:hypothetical protein